MEIVCDQVNSIIAHLVLEHEDRQCRLIESFESSSVRIDSMAYFLHRFPIFWIEPGLASYGCSE